MPKERPPTNPQPLLICGASARAAAFSALRAGIGPVCADLFADTDLARAATVVRIPHYPNDIAATVAQLPPADWIYTGALENFPQTIADIAKQRTLLGNSPATLARVRDPFALSHHLQEQDFPVLQVRDQQDQPEPDGTWVCKPLHSAGGARISHWNIAAAVSLSRHPPVYFQRRADGEAYSALFMAFPSGAELIGVTRQLVGVTEFHAAPFAYCGSIGPTTLPYAVERQIQEMGQTIARFGEMRGLFGCDFLYDGDTAWLTEVNPRYTASVEVFERCWDLPLLDWHCRACRADARPTEEQHSSHDDFRRQVALSRVQQTGVSAKAIVFAPEAYSVPDLESRFAAPPLPWSPQIADIPPPGSTIEAGHPICTVFADGASEDDGFAQLVNLSRTINAPKSGGNS
ncbi:ATP-grasp domain protein [Symmachiella macrocystis]|uniref:ATP-grasp domain protein n=1 Tax=Symmachiella macrocystis TaxID=2527985 RepID=A0A5C6BBX0_9PLAN|nr:ATP-grasp domain-containing protein [Symmachiella macrocystis]TWU09420.1 ATP-grasp domain protein [Symmachiella macrocystis]